jgi:hypothetical protein
MTTHNTNSLFAISSLANADFVRAYMLLRCALFTLMARGLTKDRMDG